MNLAKYLYTVTAALLHFSDGFSSKRCFKTSEEWCDCAMSVWERSAWCDVLWLTCKYRGSVWKEKETEKMQVFLSLVWHTLPFPLLLSLVLPFLSFSPSPFPSLSFFLFLILSLPSGSLLLLLTRSHETPLVHQRFCQFPSLTDDFWRLGGTPFYIGQFSPWPYRRDCPANCCSASPQDPVINQFFNLVRANHREIRKSRPIDQTVGRTDQRWRWQSSWMRGRVVCCNSRDREDEKSLDKHDGSRRFENDRRCGCGVPPWATQVWGPLFLWRPFSFSFTHTHTHTPFSLTHILTKTLLHFSFSITHTIQLQTNPHHSLSLSHTHTHTHKIAYIHTPPPLPVY